MNPDPRIASSFASAGMSDLLAGATQSAAAELESVLGFYWKNEESRIAQMKEFKQALCQLSAECRIVIIVDELDRCRPDYSLSLLEVIKHFFEVPSVHFVLGVNIDALKSSVSVRYGAGFDAGLYLQKFVNLTMSLPESENERSPQRYFDRVVENLRADDHSLSKRKSLLGEAEEAIKLSGFKNALTLRGVERLLNRLALFPAGLDSCAWPDRNLAVFAAALEAVDQKLLKDFLDGRLTRQVVESMTEGREKYAPYDLTHHSKMLREMCFVVIGAEVDDETKQVLRALYSHVYDCDYGRHLRRRLKENFETFSAT